MNFPKVNPGIRNLIVGLGLVLFQSCAPISYKGAPSVLGQEKISEIVASLKEQEGLVSAFFGSGSLMVEGQGPETESNVLIAGIRDPLRVKIEITHPWGRPLLDILIQDSEIRIVSYQEKRIYRGPIGGLAPSRFLPGGLAPDQIWAILRGFPILRRYDHAVSLKANHITLMNKEEEILQVVYLYKKSNLPRLISFPGQGIETLYSDYQDQGGILCADTIRLDDSEKESMIQLSRKQMVFNEPIPGAIFEQKAPSGFQVVRLKRIEEE